MRRAMLVAFSGIAGLIALVVLGLFILGWPDMRYAAAFEKIELGATRDSIVGQLGEPAVITTDCYVAQFVKFEKPTQWTKSPQVAYCGHWLSPSPGLGYFYAIGFNTDNKVVGIAYGDS